MADPVENAKEVSLWSLIEFVCLGPSDGNPFRDVSLAATFSQGERLIDVNGFYDGDGVYRIRFMPDHVGTWDYVTASNIGTMDAVRGSIEVTPAASGQRGPVRVCNEFHYRYADGTRFIPLGTTLYAWHHQGYDTEQQTLTALSDAPFTKVRMCVFPKHYRYNEIEPEFYPFPLLRKGESKWPNPAAIEGWSFDFEQFEPAYFRHLERRIADLAAMGIEADLILFHPYDRWGFSRMTQSQDDHYLRYLVSRLAAFPNIWWSIANEYDLMPSKSMDDWDRFIDVVSSSDPHGHLLSVHNCFAFYDHADPRISHASIQRPDPARSVLWRQQYGKPVFIDECCYEGDIAEAWGNITGQELVHRFWDGTVGGAYLTHGETFRNETDTIWWAKGGCLKGESISRMAFLKQILAEGPDRGLDPMMHTEAYMIALAGGLDNITMAELRTPVAGQESWSRTPAFYATAGQPHEYYLTYFGYNQPSEMAAAVPPDERYTATLIDTWEMTQEVFATDVWRGQVLRFRAKPNQTILLRRNEVG